MRLAGAASGFVHSLYLTGLHLFPSHSIRPPSCSTCHASLVMIALRMFRVELPLAYGVCLQHLYDVCGGRVARASFSAPTMEVALSWATVLVSLSPLIGGQHPGCGCYTRTGGQLDSDLQGMTQSSSFRVMARFHLGVLE